MPINLNDIRSARRESKKERPEVIFGDPAESFFLPTEFPAECLERIGLLSEIKNPEKQASKTIDLLLSVFKVLFGDSQYKAFMKHQPSLDDLMSLLDAAMPEYGFESLGESQASSP